MNASQRGYRESTLRNAYNKAKEQNHIDPLSPTTVNKVSDDRATFVSEFNNNSQEIKRIITKHCDPNLKALASSQPTFYFRRAAGT